MSRRRLAALTTLACAAFPVLADCYSDLHLDAFRPAPRRAFAIALDETTPLSSDLTEEAIHRVEAALRPGDQASVLAFSGLGRTHHTREVLVVELPTMPSEKTQADMPMRRLKSLAACVRDQAAAAKTKVGQAIHTIFQEAAGQTFATSAIVLAFREIGGRLARSTIADKVLFAVTDGAEHSDLISFYRNKELRVIDPAATLSLVAKQGLIPDLTKVRVYVMGLGLASAEADRHQKVVLALESFWKLFFERAGAASVVLGNPALLTPID